MDFELGAPAIAKDKKNKLYEAYAHFRDEGNKMSYTGSLVNDIDARICYRIADLLWTLYENEE